MTTQPQQPSEPTTTQLDRLTGFLLRQAIYTPPRVQPLTWDDVVNVLATQPCWDSRDALLMLVESCCRIQTELLRRKDEEKHLREIVAHWRKQQEYLAGRALDCEWDYRGKYRELAKLFGEASAEVEKVIGVFPD